MSKYCSHCMSELEVEAEKCPFCGNGKTPVPAHHLLPGTILNGKFYVGESLGEGGFGITYIGRDINLDMKIAIKEFYPNGYVNRNNTISPQVNDSVTAGRKNFFQNGRTRFLKEAQILARFYGESGIVDVRDFFEENNTAYIIMEYLEGVDLKTYLKQNGKLTPDQTIQMLMPVMNSLKKVHAQGLIHRDISPDNIMIVGDKIKLLDFGAARTISAAANKSLSVMLKPGYAPEEQYRSKGNQGPWTDIYALCATMYKCITGVTPDDATQRVFSDEVKTPSAMNIAIKPEIEKAIMRGMSVHQADRYQCIEELIKALNGIDIPLSASERTIEAKNEAADAMYMPNEENKTASGTEAAAAKPFVNKQAESEPTALQSPIKTNETKNTAYGVNSAAAANNVFQTPVDNKQNVFNQNEIHPFMKQNGDTGRKKTKLLLGLLIAILLIVIISLAVILVVTSNSDKDSSDDDDNNNRNISAQTTEDEPEEESTQPAEDITPEEKTTEGITAESTQAAESDKPDNKDIVMSDELFDFTFELEGVVYQLPCDYECFTNNGWTISSRNVNSDTKIAGNNYDYFDMARDGREITVYSYNASGNAKSIKDCKIGGIECYVSDNVDFVIAKGVTPSTGADEIKKQFGVPGYSNTGNDYETITYYAEKDSSYNCVKFYISNDARYSSIDMKNFIESEDDKTITNAERPDYLNKYKEPTALGKDFKSSVVKIEGDLYQLPAPVSAFIDKGWQITQHSGDVVAGGNDYIYMKKDGKELDLRIVNYAEYQTTVENCAVTKVSVYDGYGTSIIVGSESNNITIGTAKNEVDTLTGSDFDYYEGTYSHSYSYSEFDERDFGLDISVDKESGKVSSIDVSCETWAY